MAARRRRRAGVEGAGPSAPARASRLSPPPHPITPANPFLFPYHLLKMSRSKAGWELSCQNAPSGGREWRLKTQKPKKPKSSFAPFPNSLWVQREGGGGGARLECAGNRRNIDFGPNTLLAAAAGSAPAARGVGVGWGRSQRAPPVQFAERGPPPPPPLSSSRPGPRRWPFWFQAAASGSRGLYHTAASLSSGLGCDRGPL